VDELLSGGGWDVRLGRGRGRRMSERELGERHELAHAKAKAGDEGERTTSLDKKHGDVKGPVFGANLCCHSQQKTQSSTPTQ
jgi:hypothetical protein